MEQCRAGPEREPNKARQVMRILLRDLNFSASMAGCALLDAQPLDRPDWKEPSNVISFEDLALVEPIRRALKEEGYSIPTPIQAQAIPPLLAGRDLLGIAQTGTGKTAAFALPILQRLAAAKPAALRRKTARVLVLTPTRELALQIEESFRAYGRHLNMRATVIFGGVGQHPQV